MCYSMPPYGERLTTCSSAIPSPLRLGHPSRSSVSSLLSYLFPATVQAYYDQHLESFFAGNQAHLRAWKRDLPNVLIAPIIFAVDLLCAAGFVLYALASPKALAGLAAVAVVARARRAKA